MIENAAVPHHGKPGQGRGNFPTLVLLAAILILAGGSLLHTLRGTSAQEPAWHALGTDDAYITYRYARNLAEGAGPVYNAGSRVEGYSSPLHVLILAPLWWLVGDDGIYAASVVLNIGCLMALAVILSLASAGRKSSRYRNATLILLAFCPMIWMTAAMGMETPLVLLLQVLFWWQVQKSGDEEESGRSRMLPWVVMTALLVLSRADGFLMPAAAVVWLLCRRRRRPAMVVAGGLLGSMGLLTTWRLLYYGSPLPNTYYVKVSGPLLERLAAGIQSLLEIAADSGLAAFLLVWFLQVAVIWKSREKTDEKPGTPTLLSRFSPRVPPFAAFFGLLWAGYFVAVGGDVYRERMLAVLFPLGMISLVNFAVPRMRRRALILLILVVLAGQLRPLVQDRRFAYAKPKYDAWIALGRFLGEAHPGSLLAVDAAGKIPFFSKLTTVDMLGLTDAAIGRRKSDFFRVGHNKQDVGYVLSLRPDLIAVMSLDIDQNYRWGLDGKTYRQAGYRLRYLLNCNPVSQGANDILDVARTSDEEIRDLIIHGYRYGVLERSAESPANPRSSAASGWDGSLMSARN